LILPDVFLASGSLYKTMGIWDVSTGINIKILYGHTYDVYCLAVLPNGLLASGSLDRTIRIWAW